MIVRRAVLLAGILPVIALAGCGEAPAGPGVASLAGETDSGQASPTASPDSLKFAQCMREHGVDVSDPDAEGRVMIRSMSGDEAEVEAAHEACGKYMETRLGKGPDDPELQDKMLKYVQCMREHGVDMPDPDFSGGKAIISRPRNVDPEVEEKAMKACKDILPGGGPKNAKREKRSESRG